MAYPASVEHLPLARTRRRGRRQQENPDSGLLDDAQNIDNRRDKDEGSSKAGVGGVVLDFGREGGASLEKGRKGWRWDWASDSRPDLKYIAGEKATCLFPPTRSPGSAKAPTAPRNLIESSSKFIESICEPYERYGIQEAIASILGDPSQPEAGPSHTSKQPAGRREDDVDDHVYRGPVMALIYNPRARVARSILAFPVGEVGHHLNISPFLNTANVKVSQRSKLRFLPTHKVVERFPTPILQVVSSPVVSSSRIDREATALLVRLQATTHIINLIPDHSYIPPTSSSPVTTLRVAQLSYEDTESRRHVDVALDPSTWSRALVVDEKGGVWLWWEEKEVRGKLLEKVWNLRKVRSAVTEEKDQFFRIAFGTKPGTALVISSREATVIDIDHPEHPSTSLLTLKGKDRVFTSLEKTALECGSSYTVLCTTQEVMWVDEAKPGSPVLSWKHDYGSGNLWDLEVTIIPGIGQKDRCTILSSRSQPLHLAFPTTGSAPLRSLSHPYAVNLPKTNLTSFQLVPASYRHSHSLLGISQDGAVYSIPLASQATTSQHPPAKEQKKISDLRAVWDEDVQRLVKSTKAEDQEISAGRELNFRWAWLEINKPLQLGDDKSRFSPLELERYLRQLDAPMEHLVTAADLARDSTYAYPLQLRSHLLGPLTMHPGAINPTLDAVNELDITKYLPLATTLSVNIPAFQDARPSVTQARTDKDHLSVTGIRDELHEAFPSSSSATRDRQNAAQLALDLALSRTILSSEDLVLPSTEAAIESTQEEPDELFARAAGKLSLQDREPGKIKFHFLTPRTVDLDHDASEDGDRGRDEGYDQLQSIPARGLLSDWTLGEDPSTWEWRSWRKDESVHGLGTPIRSQRPIKPLPSPRPQTQPSFQHEHQHQTFSPSLLRVAKPSSLKPTVSLPNFHNLPPTLGGMTSSASLGGMNAGSSPVADVARRMQRSSPPLMMGGSSQPAETQWAATQVERGPHGGREKKKKSAKKRVGGF